MHTLAVSAGRERWFTALLRNRAEQLARSPRQNQVKPTVQLGQQRTSESLAHHIMVEARLSSFTGKTARTLGANSQKIIFR